MNGESYFHVLDNFMLTIVSLWNNYGKLPRTHHNILRFLFVGGLKINLLVGGFGVEEQQNVLCVIYVSGVGARGVYQ
jgi:hypothetical protein